jgi:hypothetical protein
MKRVYIYIIVLFLASCVKQADWEPPVASDSFVVVEAIITNEPKVQSIYLNHNIRDLNELPIPVRNASVILSNEDNTWQLKEDEQAPGTYHTDSIVVAQLDKNYSLLIVHQGNIYSAQASMVAGKTFPELSYSKNDGDELYHIDYVASSFESEDPAMWEVIINWSSVPGFEDADPDSTQKRLLFYTLPTLDVSEIFAPVLEQVSFPAGTVINENRYSLSQDHADFIRTLMLETDWQGGVFPSDPANVLTNLSDGALGYFSVCAVNSLSLVVTQEN